MVAAKAVYLREGLDREAKLFFVSMAANSVAQEAPQAAQESGRGRMAEIDQKIEDIRTREGLTDDDDWTIGEGPVEYRELVAEYEQLSGNINDTVFASVLRRYGLSEYADMFENDRSTFDQIRERGRRRFLEM
jgi:hypothetical protein